MHVNHRFIYTWLFALSLEGLHKHLIRNTLENMVGCRYNVGTSPVFIVHVLSEERLQQLQVFFCVYFLPLFHQLYPNNISIYSQEIFCILDCVKSIAKIVICSDNVLDE